MEKNSQVIMLENFTCNWNEEFPGCPLTVPDLKKPHAVMNALFQVFDRLGIDKDAILAPPPEECRNEHLKFYWDLLPVINMTRVVNHFVSCMPRMTFTITITHFLTPMVTTSHSILFVLFNLMIFNESRLRDIKPQEDILFSLTDEIKKMEDKKNKLIELLNEQVLEKENRAQRVKKLNSGIKQVEEELKVEKEPHNEEQQELQLIMKENKQIAIILEQKKGQKDGLIAEIEKNQAMRVYDADDIKAQADQAAHNVQDADEKLKSLRETLMQKENSIKNLQTIKPKLDAANNLLHDIQNLHDSLRDYESGDHDADNKEDELDIVNKEISELTAQLAELRAVRADAANKRCDAHAKRQQDRARIISNLRDAEEKDRKCKERCKRAIQRTQEIKEMTAKYEQERAERFEELAHIQKNFTDKLKSLEDTLLKKAIDAKKKIEDRVNNRSG